MGGVRSVHLELELDDAASSRWRATALSVPAHASARWLPAEIDTVARLLDDLAQVGWTSTGGETLRFALTHDGERVHLDAWALDDEPFLFARSCATLLLGAALGHARWGALVSWDELAPDGDEALERVGLEGDALAEDDPRVVAMIERFLARLPAPDVAPDVDDELPF